MGFQIQELTLNSYRKRSESLTFFSESFFNVSRSVNRWAAFMFNGKPIAIYRFSDYYRDFLLLLIITVSRMNCSCPVFENGIAFKERK